MCSLRQLHQIKHALRRLKECLHLAALSEVAYHLGEEAYVRLRVEQVLIAKLLGLLVANCLLEDGSAGTSLIH